MSQFLKNHQVRLKKKILKNLFLIHFGFCDHVFHCLELQQVLTQIPQCSLEYATFRNLELSGAGSYSSGWPNAKGYSRTSCWWLRATHAICGKEQNHNLHQQTTPAQGKEPPHPRQIMTNKSIVWEENQKAGKCNTRWIYQQTAEPREWGKKTVADLKWASKWKTKSKTINCTHTKNNWGGGRVRPILNVKKAIKQLKCQRIRLQCIKRWNSFTLITSACISSLSSVPCGCTEKLFAPHVYFYVCSVLKTFTKSCPNWSSLYLTSWSFAIKEASKRSSFCWIPCRK